MTVGSVTGFPVNYPYTLAVDYEGVTMELVQVTNAAGTTLTIQRAIDGTSAASHNAGARVRHVSSARDYSDSRDHENADDGIHGLALGDVIVGEDAVQTLTNKTLVSPTVTGTIAGSPSFAGTWTGTTASTAKMRLSNSSDVSLVSTNHAFQVGEDLAQNIRMDTNEIMAVSNGAISTLTIQNDGGNTTFNSAAGADGVTNSITANGTVQANVHSATRTSGLSNAVNVRITGDAQPRATILANGAINWGNGTAIDTNLFRSAANTLRTDDSFIVGGTTFTAATDASVGATLTTADLVVTGNITFPMTTVPGATLLAAASGWSIAASAAGVIKAGIVYAVMRFTRTGAGLATNANGQLTAGPSPMGTVGGSFRPNTALGLLECHAGNTAGTGTASVSSTTGVVTLNMWQASQTIGTGDNVTVTLTWPLP